MVVIFVMVVVVRVVDVVRVVMRVVMVVVMRVVVVVLAVAAAPQEMEGSYQPSKAWRGDYSPSSRPTQRHQTTTRNFRPKSLSGLMIRVDDKRE